VFDFDGCPAPLEEAGDSAFVGDNDHGDAVPPPPLTPEDIMMRNQELANENFDLKMKMQMVEARAIRAEKRYERMKEHGARMRIAEFIVASEPFMWLMAGSNFTESNLKALRPAYDKWKESGGLPDMMARINKEQREALDNLSKLDEELGLYEPKKEEEQCYGECWAAKERIAELEGRHTDFLNLQEAIGILRAELAQRTAERDEARREYCEARADLRSTPTSPEVIAAERGWDCFKEEER
jgi:hypothetical protein